MFVLKAAPKKEVIFGPNNIALENFEALVKVFFFQPENLKKLQRASMEDSSTLCFNGKKNYRRHASLGETGVWAGGLCKKII